MAKNIIEDVRSPKGQRSIRQVSISHPAQSSKRIMPPQVPEETVYEQDEPIRATRDRDNRDRHENRNSNIINLAEDSSSGSGFHSEHNSKYLLWGVVFVCIVVLLFTLSTFFVSATVTVIPKSETAPVNASLPVNYQAFVVSLSAATTVPSDGQMAVSKKASGQIVIYNNYSANPQTFVANTRFEASGSSASAASASSGLIYRTPTTITIPGKVGSVPGSLTVTVYADQPGAKYNVGLSDFTVPGLASNAAEYAGFYARSKTVMSGGESGMIPQVAAADLAAAKETLEGKLQAQLASTVTAQLPSQYALLPGTATTTFVSALSTAPASAPTNSAAAPSVPLTEKATYIAMIFNRADLSSALAAAAISKDYAGGAIDISNINQLHAVAAPADISALVNQYSSQSSASPIVESATSSAVVSFSGQADFIWQYSPDDLKTALEGQPSGDVFSVLDNFPSISSAKVVIRPFWISTLPKNPNKITIVSVPPVSTD